MEITVEAIERVIDETGVDFKTAKQALEEKDGNAEAAIRYLNPEKEEKVDTEDIMARLKAKIDEGNVSKIQIRRKDEILMSVPVNVGIIGGAFGVLAAPWAMIAGAVAAFGFGCTLEVVKKDGTVDKVAANQKKDGNIDNAFDSEKKE